MNYELSLCVLSIIINTNYIITWGTFDLVYGENVMLSQVYEMRKND